MSLNIQESDLGGRKRSHDEFAGDAVTAQSGEGAKDLVISPKKPSVLPAIQQSLSQSTPRGSPGLSEPGSITPANIPGSPITPKAEKTIKCDPTPDSKTNSSQPATLSAPTSTSTPATTSAVATQPQKRKRLTAAEKEARDKEAAEKKKEKEEKAAAKAVEKAAKNAKAEEEKAAREKEKTARAKEREEKQKKKAEEERLKDEKKRQVQEAKEKEARKQPKLNSFFGAPRTPSKHVNTEAATSRTESPKKDDTSVDTAKVADAEYRKRFKPFFVKEHTRLANPSWYMDEDTREAKSRILDQFVSGDRTLDESSLPWDPVELFSLPRKPPRRGKVHPSVRTIMESIYRQTEESNGSSNSQTAIQLARQQLSKIVTKVIAFSQDVRAPYYGTVTVKQHSLGIDQMRKVARNTNAKRLPLDYEYDSEAEWQEDEDGEDVDMEDDEEDVEDEDDMDGFLDDSEDAGPARRLLVNTLEPDCSGICFEDDNKNGPNTAVYEHRMEFIIDHNEASLSINPWSNAYWEPAPKKAQAGDTGVVMPPPPAPSSAFAALTGAPPPPATKLVKNEILNDVKKAILDNKGLSKVGIIEFVFQQFRDNASRAEVKNTIELVAEKKKGSGKTKEWDLKPGHEIKL